MSDYFECPVGLKQGCMLSPRLFTIFISEISRVLNDKCSNGIQFLSNFDIIHHLFFADDVILVSDTVQGLQQKLNILEQQSNRLGLKINLEKTKIIVFRKGGFLSKYEHWFYEGNKVDVVNSYKYLGFDFTTKMSMQSSISSFVIKSKSALNSLTRSLNAIDCNNMHIFFKLFDTQVVPILSYSCELWGVYNIKEIEIVHTLAIKRFLNVSVHCSNSIVYAETGRFPLYINHTIRSIQYWFKLLKMPHSRISKQAYLMLKAQSNKGKDNWVTRIKNVLCENGFAIVWMFEHVTNEKVFLKSLKNRLIDIFKQNWTAKMIESDHLSFFFSFKSLITPEKFLNIPTYDNSLRHNLVKLRCSVSNLNAHRYKYYKNECLLICPFCPNSVENEMHSVFVCTAYEDIRIKYIPNKFRLNINKQNLIILFSNEQYTMSLCKYLRSMFAIRKKLLE